MKLDSLPIAVRVFPELQVSDKPVRKRRPWRNPEAMFVFDTETRTDATQSLMFGSYRFIRAGQCLEEGLFYADDLSANERRVLESYVKSHRADTDNIRNSKLQLLTLDEFLDKLFLAVYKGRCLLVGFNLPFDLSRIASDFTNARGRFAGGFSLGLWTYEKDGQRLTNRYRPRIGIKHIDSKRVSADLKGSHSGRFEGEPRRRVGCP